MCHLRAWEEVRKRDFMNHDKAQSTICTSEALEKSWRSPFFLVKEFYSTRYQSGSFSLILWGVVFPLISIPMF